MPVNFQQALQQIHEMGSQALMQQERLKALREEAEKLLHQFTDELDSLEQLVMRAAAENSHLRCAAPFGESLEKAFPAPPITSKYTLLAADGSQINPDRHGQVEFGAINVGAIRMKPGQGQPPEEMVQSTLMFHDDLFTSSGGLMTDDLVALKRDLAERQVLANLARGEPPPVLALTDGPLELFREPRNLPEFETELENYQNVLEDLADLGAGTAGYVDRPRGDLIVRLLELIILNRTEKLSEAGQAHPLQGVIDTDLYKPLLQPGERSAIFAIHSGSAKSFQGRLSLHFFFLNTGRVGKAYISRVEIPRWVAENKALVDLLHACLVEQAHHLGVKPYPYILHRAHEIAVISFDEHHQLENMIVGELYRQGINSDERSNKQIAKDASSNHTRSR